MPRDSGKVEVNGPQPEEPAAVEQPEVQVQENTMPEITNGELAGLVVSKALSGVFNGFAVGAVIGTVLAFAVISDGGWNPSFMEFLSVPGAIGGALAAIGGMIGLGVGMNQAGDIRQKSLENKLEQQNQITPTR